MEQTQPKKQYHVHYGPAGGRTSVDFDELWRYKDLIWLFVKRDFTVLYKQTVLGPAWILINPLLSMAMYTVMFGTIANLSTGGVPQPLFYLAGTAVWTFFSSCINKFVMFFCLLLFYVVCGEVAPNWAAMPLLLPIVLQVGLLGLGCGIIVSSVTTRYRDLMVVVTFGVQLWMYGTPVVYPLSMISNPLLRAVMIANPMTAPMESFRAVCFNSGEVSVLMWVISLAWTVALLAVGVSLFGKVEKTFVDTV